MDIIVVDNDPVMIRFLKDVLTGDGHRVTTATSGVETLELLKRESPRMIFIDYVMPNIDGKTLCRMIRGMPGRAELFITILSAIAAEEWSDIHEIGADIYMAKAPLDKMGKAVKWVVQNPEEAASRCAAGEVIGLKNVFPRGITKELLQTKRHFELILNRMTEGIVEIDEGGRVVFANPAAFEIFGRSESGLLGAAFIDLFSGENRARIEKRVAPDRVTSGRIAERQPLTVNGRTVTAEFLALEEAGAGGGALAIFQDVSEYVKTAQELSTTNAFLEQILNSSESISIVSTDREGNILFWNKGAENILGYKADELVGKQKIDILYPGREQSEQARSVREEVFRTRKSACSEIQEIGKDGEQKLIRINLSPVVDDAGDVVGIQGIGKDVTEWKRAEKALRESEEKFRVIFESAKDGIFIKDRNRLFSLANSAMAAMLNIEPHRMVGETEESLLGAGNDNDGIAKDDSRVLSGSVVERELTLVIDGEAVQLHVVKVPVHDDSGGVVAICGIARDLSKMRQLEAQFRQKFKMEALGTLAGGIAHDFNNLLAVINGFAELALNRAKKTTRLYDNLVHIFNAGNRAKELVHQILAFVQKADAEPKPVDMGRLVEESLGFLRASLPATVEIESELNSRAILMADPIQIQQVIMNLCTNAAQAMADSGGRLHVGIEEVVSDGEPEAAMPGASKGRYLRLVVSDTGPGIPPEIMGRIFDPYFTTKEMGKGTGMGLAVAQGIVQSRGGIITAENRSGRGARFTVLLPLAEGGQLEPIKIEGAAPGGKEKLLFVDDEEGIVEMVGQMLTHLGYSVAKTSDPDEALGWVEASPDAFDMVISDMTMPNMTGDRLAAAVKKIRPDLPVILCTGFSESISGEGIGPPHVDAVLMKPFNLDKVANTIRKIFDGKPQE